MNENSKVESTLFVPMLGRIYASEHFPHLLYDEKALTLKKLLPNDLKGQDTQTQYTLLASAIRSCNMDRYIKQFMKTHEDGIIVELGCGLETSFYRNDDGKHIWYEVDLPNVITYREQLLPVSDRDRYIAGDGFSDEWIKIVRKEFKTQPMLVVVSGVFYYFEKSVVLNLFKTLKLYGPVEVVFDTVNEKGMKRMSKYMKQVGHEDASMYFYVDDAQTLCQEIKAKAAFEEPYYNHTDKKGIGFITAMTMRLSDVFNMVKMVDIKL